MELLFETLFGNIYTLYLYTFSEFVEHALRLQVQSEHRLSVKCVNISKVFLKKNKKSIKMCLLF